MDGFAVDASDPGEPEPTGWVFLCHASEDVDTVATMYDFLKNAGHEPWLDKRRLLPGQEWKKEIRED